MSTVMRLLLPHSNPSERPADDASPAGPDIEQVDRPLRELVSTVVMPPFDWMMTQVGASKPFCGQLDVAGC